MRDDVLRNITGGLLDRLLRRVLLHHKLCRGRIQLKSTGFFNQENREQLEIRRAGPDHAQAIAQVLQRSFMEFESLYTAGGFAATTLGSEQILLRMQEGPVWIAIREGVALQSV